MERLKRLEGYQKGILILLAAMVLVFTAVYSVAIAREGFAYRDAILVPVQENGNMVYSGKINGTQARFTVYADKTVEFQYGDEAYGPYTAKEDPTALPKEDEMRDFMTGVELHCGEEIIFRGGVQKVQDDLWLYNTNGDIEGVNFITAFDGTRVDENGNVIDQMEPSASAILDLMAGPELVHKGEWSVWFRGVLVCILTAVSILYAEELFRWGLSLRIRNAKQAEPSEWEIVSRYLSWIVLLVAALAVFVIGLQ